MQVVSRLQCLHKGVIVLHARQLLVAFMKWVFEQDRQVVVLQSLQPVLMMLQLAQMEALR
jgi:hypothetical protein